MTNISSDEFLNFSTEFQDPYNVEPDLSAGVGHLVILSQVRHCTDLCYVSGFHYLLPVSHAGGALWLYHEFHRVLALLEKQKGWKLEKEVLGL